MKTECLQTKLDTALFWKGKNKVALMKSLIYVRVWKRHFEGRAYKRSKESCSKVDQNCTLIFMYITIILAFNIYSKTVKFLILLKKQYINTCLVFVVDTTIKVNSVLVEV